MSPARSTVQGLDEIRVLLADDHAVVRAGLKAVLGAAKDIVVVGEARNGREAVEAAVRLNPHVVVMDLSMDEMDGISATRELKKQNSTARILILTMHAEDEFLVPTLDAGASGYLVKNAADRELIDAVRTVAHGGQYLQAAAARTLAKELKRRGEHQSERDQFNSLSERERDIVRFIAAGYSSPEIGEKLNISPKTVDTYKQRVGEKIGLTHRADYVKLAVRLGLLDSV
ncbi:MAG: response regulator transcription factor [Phycisphaerae bacterium]|nr:response regulator transcription factor [Gemmatimonadaceae bacterium]